MNDSGSIQVSDFLDVRAHARAIGCNDPHGIALLPMNFSSARSVEKLVHYPAVTMLRAALRAGGIVETPLEEDPNRISTLIREGADPNWIIPAMFIAQEAINQHPLLVSLCLNVVGNFATDWIKNVFQEKAIDPLDERVYFDLVIQNGKKCSKFSYRGPLRGLSFVLAAVKRIRN